jgi:hypothetical protein
MDDRTDRVRRRRPDHAPVTMRGSKRTDELPTGQMNDGHWRDRSHGVSPRSVHELRSPQRMKREGEAPAEPPPTTARQEARPPKRHELFEGDHEGIAHRFLAGGQPFVAFVAFVLKKLSRSRQLVGLNPSLGSFPIPVGQSRRPRTNPTGDDARRDARRPSPAARNEYPRRARTARTGIRSHRG